MSEHFDVVIIGFGPTGATLANLLGLSGVSVLLLDRERQSCQLPRAVHFDDEVMRVFQTIGISDQLAKRLRVNAGMRFVNRDTGKLLLDWPRPQEMGPNGWYASYRFHQPELEYMLHDNLKRFPSVEIRSGCEAQEIEDFEGSVEVVYEDLKKGERRRVSGAYLVGCEGANSLTCKCVCDPAEEAIEDFDYNQHWLVVDLVLNHPKPELSDYTMQYCHPEKPVTCARGPGLRRRWEFSLSEEERREPLEDADVWERLQSWVTREEAQLERHAVYQFHATLALKWQRNRMFIAGDAAHQTPPFMGQGMCAGIRDAANLGWKLQLSLICKTEALLLNSYAQERIANVRRYITTAIDLGKVVNSDSDQDLFDKLKSAGGKMKSLKSKLGKGLAVQENDQVGSLFPQPLYSRIDDRPILLDDHSGYAPSLLITDDLKAGLSDKEMTALNKLKAEGFCVVWAEPGSSISDVLVHLGLKAVLVRPDRYILATAEGAEEFGVVFKQAQQIRQPRSTVFSS
ncbi:MAG: bifunctional 3-(3-hydroxy-phenyl)propionate/3-hydroxycinnamic acid hydroxylase [Candidatus Latescibacterota bacterium]|nr:bifunctional 3-(3-hydroxy-phenyl)propionate/3-hydroxycinnamic acid hydroxylase [Candidatus Latescibacterota bacterium]